MTALRCRQGDLAVVTGPCQTPGLRGRFVIIERRTYGGEVIEGLRAMPGDEPTWLCRAASSGGTLPRAAVHPRTGAIVYTPSPVRIIADAILTPIRPVPGEDEMLRLAGKPRVEELA